MTRAQIKLAISVALVISISVIFIVSVDMRPKISPDFFFGSDDPEIAETKAIAQLFPAEEFLVLSVESPDISSHRYYSAVKKLTDTLTRLPGFSRVISITEGPASLRAAKDSPFWRPLLINEDESATLVLVFLSRDASSRQVPVVEEIAYVVAQNDAISGIHISGMPYIVEQIRKSLVRDAKLFSTTVLVLFALLLWGLYRSPVIAVGASVAGISAIFLSLTILQMLAQPVGILTANLAIIIFVLVQSQVIYLTNNWLREESDDISDQIKRSLKKTFPASFWCSVTTFLGFLSLLFVSAEPLRQLGMGGITGVLVSLACCYIIFPPFLAFARKRKQGGKKAKKMFGRKMRILQFGGAAILVIWAFLSVSGLFKLQTDPSLFSYFQQGGDIETGLSSIDRNGGSSPMQLVVSLKDGGALDSKEAYEKLWKLHNSFADIDQVGTVLSLPALMAEANDHPLAFLLPWSQIVSLLAMEANQNAVENFLSSDRRQALFLLRMKEGDRSRARTSVITDVESRVSESGFRLDHSGGVYVLQGRLSALVGSSVTTGIISLLGLFAGISFLLTRNWRLSLAMFATATVVPMISLGGIGYLSVPLDVISAPALSVTLGLAVDALIHLSLSVTRKREKGRRLDVWKVALQEQGSGIIASSGIIFLGFLVFSLSDFPPTTRFGVTVIVGSVLAGLGALTLFPVLSKLAAPSLEK